jgi:hypothetical protein
VSEPDRSRLALALVGVSKLAADDAVCRRVGRVTGVVGYAGDNAEVRTGVDVVDVAGTGGGDVSADVSCFSESGRLDGIVLTVNPNRSHCPALTLPVLVGIQPQRLRAPTPPQHAHMVPFPPHPPLFPERVSRTLQKVLEGEFGPPYLFHFRDGQVIDWDPTAH